MSNRLLNECRPLQVAPTAKSVLMALADFANESGECWPSVQAICEWTCYSERAVRNAIRSLESSGHIVCMASKGRTSNRYFINANPAGSAELTRQQVPGTDSTNPASDAESTRHLATPTRHLTTPTRHDVPPNPKEPLRTPSKATKKNAPACAVARPDDVDEQIWLDWLALRKAKKAPVTETVLAHATAEAAKAQMPLTKFLGIWCARGSQGLQAEWLKPNERAGPPGAKPSAAASFHGKTYTGTPIDDIPESLRPAA